MKLADIRGSLSEFKREVLGCEEDLQVTEAALSTLASEIVLGKEINPDEILMLKKELESIRRRLDTLV